MDAIQLLITLGVAAIVIWAVVAIVKAMGIPIPQFVWIIAAAIIGIILLLWLGRVLPGLLPG